MTRDFDEMEQRRYFTTAARLANGGRISAVEERWIRGYLDRYVQAEAVEPGFPEGPSGDRHYRNNLRRTNWFNGRYLTAEALSRQDVYFDHRARLNAHALMPGIAWGLGIVGKGSKQLSGPGRPPGVLRDDTLTLRRGLAFDGVGRPILVSQDADFTLAELIGVAQTTPRQVVGGEQEFMPCVCLAPDPQGASGGGPALPNGPFLLVIEAGERPEGKAKVTGDVCGGRASANCEADVWQGSFRLSLVRFPLEVPLLKDIKDRWALRGALSAYYFDVFEHSLAKRWQPDFPIDGSFQQDSGPGRHEGMAIPLAMVHLDDANNALYLDSWIPRRLITATPGEDWHRTCFGAPPRAAAWARLHQFQTMLEESLAERPLAGSDQTGLNLHQRGFRHLPPIGFLPVTPPRLPKQEKTVKLKHICTKFFEMANDRLSNPYAGNQASFQSTYERHKDFNQVLDEIPGSIQPPKVQNPPIINPPGDPITPPGDPIIAAGEKIKNTNQAADDLIAFRRPTPAAAEDFGSENHIAMNKGVRGLVLFHRDQSETEYTTNTAGKKAIVTRYVVHVSLSITLAQLAEKVALRIMVDCKQPKINSPGVGVWVEAYGPSDASGQASLLGKQEVLSSDTLETITIQAKGIQKVIIRSETERVVDEAYLTEFCYTTSQPVAVPVLGARAQHVRMVLRQAEEYFLGTNVLPYAVVALHDDDILEDLHLVIDKDPLQLQPAKSENLNLEGFGKFFVGKLSADARKSPVVKSVSLWLSELLRYLHKNGTNIDALVNRQVEVVKLIVPLEGLYRSISSFSASSLPARRMQAFQNTFRNTFQSSESAPAGLEHAIEVLPRAFVVYVKQRMVLLDVLYKSLEAMQEFFDFLISIYVDSVDDGKQTATSTAPLKTNVLHQIAQGQPESSQLLMRSTLAQPLVRDLVLKTLAAAIPPLVATDRTKIFLDQVQAASEALPASIEDPQEREALALGQVTDGWAAEFPEVRLLQVLAALQPPQQTLKMVRELNTGAAATPGSSVGDGLKFQPPGRFATEMSRALYAESRQRLEQRPLHDLLGDPQLTAKLGSLTVGEFLARTPQEAASLLGGADKVAAVGDAFLKERQAALEAAKGLADGAPPEMVARLEVAVAEGVQPDEALLRLKVEEEAKPEQERDPDLLRKIAGAQTLLRVSGNQFESLRPLRRRPGG